MIADIFLCGTVALLLCASYVDVVSLRIPNELSASIAALFVPYAIAVHMPLADIALHVASGAAMLGIGFVLFSIGLRFGGGDAKLFAALTLWCGFSKLLLLFFVVMCFVGGGIAILLVMLREFGIPVWLAAHGWHFPALHTDPRKACVPYAPAMAFGFIYVAMFGLSA